MGVTTRGFGGEAPSRRRPTGVWGQSTLELRLFYSLFSKKYAFLGIFWSKFLLKNSFFKCLNKMCWCASKGRSPRCMLPLVLLPLPLSVITLEFKNILPKVSAENFPGGVMGKTRPKIAPLSLPLLYQYYVWKSMRGHDPLPPLPTPMHTITNACCRLIAV